MFNKIKKIFLYALLVYTIVGFFVLPLILKPQLIDIVQKQTNAKISIDSIYFNPYIFRLKINDIELTDANDKDLFSLKALIINVELYSLLNSTVHLSQLELQEPKVFLIYNKDKTINLASILKQEKKKQQEESTFEMPRIVLNEINIKNGGIKYEDYTNKTPFYFSFDRIGLELKDIDTQDFDTSDASIRFHTNLGDGGFFDFKSKIIGFKPFIVKGSVDFEASKLYTQWKYAQDNLNLEIADGKINFNAEYYFNVDDLNATSIDNLNIAVHNLRIKPKNQYKDVLNLKHLEVSGVNIKPMQKNVQISSVDLDSLLIKVKRDKDANIDWLEFIKTNFPPTDANSTKEEVVASEPWNVVSDKIALKKISIEFDDKAIKPNVNTNLNELNIYLDNVTLKGEDPFSYKMDMKINEEFICNSLGNIKHETLNIEAYTKCSGLNVIEFRPYIDTVAKETLRVYDVKLKNAVVGFDANVSLSTVDDEIQTNVNEANFNLSKFVLDKRSTNERLVSFSDFSINDLNLSTKTKNINIGKTTLNSLNIKARLYKDGKINLDNLIVAKASKQTKSKSKTKEVGYRVKLKHFALKSARVSFNDKTLSPSLTTKLDRIYFNAYNIDSKTKTWLNYNMSMRLNSKGYAKAKGVLRHTPLKEKGSFELKKISLKEFSPYIQKGLYLKLNDGYINLKSKTKYEKNNSKADLRIDGLIDINKVLLVDSRDDSTLLSFNKLDVKSFEYDMFPNRAFINELGIDGFYVNAIIDESKKMNFASLSKVPLDANTTKNEDGNATKFPFKIMKLDIASGSAKFADLSLPLKFKTNIHDLNGVIYSISNQEGEISHIDIVGEVNEYGSTKLKGSVDSANPKLYTDLNFNFKNLDLNTLSGYSADFAGYEIDSGRLFLDLGYNILNSELVGSNSVIIKNIKLGDEIEDENSSSLPLGFAIALLEDGDGIIDIDMPVEGNIDEPDFKYGALVWKTFGNLIIKAVASPFKFLGSMMGINGEELEYLEFEPGLTTILPPEREKLDNITKLMLKRPKISLKITPQYDDKQDLWVLKQKKLIAIVIKESGAKNKIEQENAMNIDLLEDIYEKMLPKKDVAAIEKSLEKKYKGKTLQRVYFNEVVKELTSIQSVTIKELQTLANKRVELITEYLVDTKGINTKRVVVLIGQNTEEVQEKWVRTKMEVEIK